MFLDILINFNAVTHKYQSIVCVHFACKYFVTSLQILPSWFYISLVYYRFSGRSADRRHTPLEILIGEMRFMVSFFSLRVRRCADKVVLKCVSAGSHFKTAPKASNAHFTFCPHFKHKDGFTSYCLLQRVVPRQSPICVISNMEMENAWIWLQATVIDNKKIIFIANRQPQTTLNEF